MSRVARYLDRVGKYSLKHKIVLVIETILISMFTPLALLVTFLYYSSIAENATRNATAAAVIIGHDIEVLAKEAGAIREKKFVDDQNTDVNASVAEPPSSEKNDFPVAVHKTLVRADAVKNIVFAAYYGVDGKRFDAWADTRSADVVPSVVPTKDYSEVGTIALVKVPLSETNQKESVVVGIDVKENYNRFYRQVAIIYSMLFGIILVFVCILWYAIRIMVVDPIQVLDGAVEQIAKYGKLNVVVKPRKDDELGRLTVNFMSLVEQLKRLLVTSDEISGQMIKAGQAARGVTRSVAEGASNVGSFINSATTNMEELLSSINNVYNSMERLSFSADAGLASVNEVNTLTKTINVNVQNMGTAINSSTQLIAKMGRSVEESAKNVSELSDAIVSTSASMLEIERSVKEVENNAQNGASSTKLVEQKVGDSAKAIKLTTDGIANIRRSSEEAAEAINNLGVKIGDIGSILHVIEDITKQTNLLALNAAIIAAQSGEHGRGFTVVSDEIAALAQRTRSSTLEIAELIESIQDESRHAVAAMEQDMRYIDQGVVLGENAESLLHELQKSVVESTRMSELIADSAVQQTDAIKTVNKSIENVAHSIQLITASLDEQSSGAKQIVLNTASLNDTSKELLSSVNEQSTNMSDIVEVISNFSKKVLEIKADQKRRTEDTKHALEAVRGIQSVCHQQSSMVSNLGQSVDPIEEMITNLQELLSHYRV